ncbi:MAG: terpene cyclase/mutase family protein [Planctomycetes bacterium]|nr:terpene cyclase/mutase family protein [Planctomycetota bacterium]
MQRLARIAALFLALSVALLAAAPRAAALQEAPKEKPKVDGPAVGIGGGDRGAYGGRFGGKRNVRASGGKDTEEPLERALEWLAKDQAEDGSWGADQRVLTTGLALAALLGDGSTPVEGPHKAAVAKGVAWLTKQMDADGRIALEGDASGTLGHAVATLALCEAAFFTRSPLLEPRARKAAEHLAATRAEGAAWDGEGEAAEVTAAWGCFALLTARETGLAVDAVAATELSAWLDANAKSEAGKAAALMSAIFVGRGDMAQLATRGEALAAGEVAYAPDATDLQAWFHGTYACFQLGGKAWNTWNRAHKAALLEAQVQKGKLRGSWEPVTTAGQPQSRAYATAMGALSLEVYFRYAKVPR